MERRKFLKIITAGAIALGIEGKSQTMNTQSSNEKRFLAVTMDDPNTYQTPLLSPDERNLAILKHLDSHKIRAALFICGERVDNPEGNRLLSRWNDAGHMLGNHTYSHPYYHSNKIDSVTYIEDIIKCENILTSYGGNCKRFRYPFLKAGNTIEKRDSVRKYLKKQGYRHGYVTIDTSDWYIEERLKTRLKSNPGLDPNPYKVFYIKHMLDRANYYDDLAKRALGRRIRHTLLIHHNLLNAMFLGDLLNALKENGWSLIDASNAFEDPIFELEPDIIPAGESITWAVVKESGKFDDMLRYPAEDGSYEEPKLDALDL